MHIYIQCYYYRLANNTVSLTFDKKKEEDKAWWGKYKWYIIGGAIGLSVLIIIIVIVALSKRRSRYTPIK